MTQHEFLVVGENGRVVRFCQHCDVSYILHQQYDSKETRWVAIVTEKGTDCRTQATSQPVRTAVTPTTPTTSARGNGLAAVEAAAKNAKTATPTEGKCFCEECRGKSQHWQDDGRCFCKKCKGEKTHYA